jgi:hypothetical protein
MLRPETDLFSHKLELWSLKLSIIRTDFDSSIECEPPKFYRISATKFENCASGDFNCLHIIFLKK